MNLVGPDDPLFAEEIHVNVSDAQSLLLSPVRSQSHVHDRIIQSPVQFRGIENALAYTDDFDLAPADDALVVPSFSVSANKFQDGRLIVIPAEEKDYHDVNDSEIDTILGFDVSDDGSVDNQPIYEQQAIQHYDEYSFTLLTDDEKDKLLLELDKHNDLQDPADIIRLDKGSPSVSITIGNIREILTGDFKPKFDLSHDAIDGQINLHNDTEATLGSKNIEMKRFLYYPVMFVNKILFRQDLENTPATNNGRYFSNIIHRNPFLGYSYLVFTFASMASRDTRFCFDKPYDSMRDTKGRPKKAPVWVVYIVFFASDDRILHGVLYYSTRHLSHYENQHIALVKSDINQYLFDQYCGYGFSESSYSVIHYDDVFIESKAMPSGLVMLILLSIFSACYETS